MPFNFLAFLHPFSLATTVLVSSIVKYHFSFSNTNIRGVNWNKLIFTNIGNNLSVHKIDSKVLHLMILKNVHDILNKIGCLGISLQKKGRKTLQDLCLKFTGLF